MATMAQHPAALMGSRTAESAQAENWFVAQLKPNGQHLAERNLRRQGFACFLPRRPGPSGPKPLFPGYLFVQFDPAGRDWPAINATRGISRLILADHRRPDPLPHSFIAGLLARCDAGGLVSAEQIVQGDRVRVLAGPFADIVSTVEQLTDGQRLQLLLDLMGRTVRVELDRHSIEKLHCVQT